MRFLLLLLLCTAVLINARDRNSKNLMAKQRAQMRSVKDRNDDQKIISDDSSAQSTFTIINEQGDEKCVQSGGYCVSNQPQQCFGDVVNSPGFCAGDRVCCSPKHCMTNSRYGICKPAGNCKIQEGEQAIPSICGPDTATFECCLHPVFTVPSDTGKTVSRQDCELYNGASILAFIGNSGLPVEVVKIHREYLADQTLYDQDPTKADNTLIPDAACDFAAWQRSADLQGKTSPVITTPPPVTPPPVTPPPSTPQEENPPTTPPHSTPVEESPASEPFTPPPQVQNPSENNQPHEGFLEISTTTGPENSGYQLKIVRAFQTVEHQTFLRGCYETKTCPDGTVVGEPAYAGYSIFGNGNVIEITSTPEGLKWAADQAGYYGFRKTQFPNVYQWFPHY